MRIDIEWDFGDTDLDGFPYQEAVELSGLPETILVPIDISIGEDEDITDWVSEEYGYTVLGWTEIDED